jgi:hypothetical protein
MTGRTPNRFGCFKWGYTLPPGGHVAEALKPPATPPAIFGNGTSAPCADSPLPAKRFDRGSQPTSSRSILDGPHGKAYPNKGKGSQVIVAPRSNSSPRCQGKTPFLP